MILKVKFLIILPLLFVSCAPLVFADYNAGFVKGLWYSKMPFFAGEDVRIYTVIQNQAGFDIIGTVNFFDNDRLLGQSDFSIVNGRLTEKWVDWKPLQGEHNISIQISNAKKIEIGKEPEDIKLTANTIGISQNHNVDLDTDGDGIGNKDDFDDDGDGYSDEEERETGANPLVFDKSKIKEEDTSKNENKTTIVNSERDEDSTLVENVTEKTTELVGIATEKTIEIVDDTREFLEKQKKKVVEELEQERKEEALKDLPKIDESKNPYVASIIGSIPELKEVYSFLLSVLIYILNSWWILLGSVIILVYLIWKIIRRRLRKRF